MNYMLCRQNVADFEQWKLALDARAEAHEEAWLFLQNVWRSLDNPAEVFFLFEVVDLDRAKDFVGSPGAVPSPLEYRDVRFLTD